ncbi:hypothetical protein J4E90_005913 [Alternaria incomplexa]|uniref:uncharacterized protein n=1 Tax=Alternaria incomplexa TaxID=1187928 RepID=UPI0022204435|nr:uncharacterized protein J4E90_005913 [Alternaria incomplexa]KAI4912509.1 hypothetical protein J4E90_005913 [Alternaria incomplexa]
MRSLVKKGNTIHVPAHFLGGEKSEKITLNWSQWLGSHSEDYYVCNYTVKSGVDDASGLIFVQADKVDEFKSKKTDGEDLTVTVDESFEYGQNVDMTKRFLVFHNTDNRPYQVIEL